jgi:hypothetical protein
MKANMTTTGRTKHRRSAARTGAGCQENIPGVPEARSVSHLTSPYIGLLARNSFRIGQPLIGVRHKTPREIKRFLKRVRYIARHRRHAIPARCARNAGVGRRSVSGPNRGDPRVRATSTGFHPTAQNPHAGVLSVRALTSTVRFRPRVGTKCHSPQG